MHALFSCKMEHIYIWLDFPWRLVQAIIFIYDNDVYLSREALSDDGLFVLTFARNKVCTRLWHIWSDTSDTMEAKKDYVYYREGLRKLHIHSVKWFLTTLVVLSITIGFK